MNRRGFLGAMLQAGAATAFLPAAVTYGRRWKRTEAGIVTPALEPIVLVHRQMAKSYIYDSNGNLSCVAYYYGAEDVFTYVDR